MGVLRGPNGRVRTSLQKLRDFGCSKPLQPSIFALPVLNGEGHYRNKGA